LEVAVGAVENSTAASVNEGAAAEALIVAIEPKLVTAAANSVLIPLI
jgi:hypothetical protein